MKFVYHLNGLKLIELCEYQFYLVKNICVVLKNKDEEAS
jgi:hypothetical protein